MNYTTQTRSAAFLLLALASLTILMAASLTLVADVEPLANERIENSLPHNAPAITSPETPDSFTHEGEAGMAGFEPERQRAAKALLPVLNTVFPERALTAGDAWILYSLMDRFEERELSVEERGQLRQVVGYSAEEYRVLMSAVALGNYEHKIDIDFSSDPSGSRNRILEYASSRGWLQ
jgi:hypothetical protein